MWPFRPEKLTDLLSREDVSILLQLSDSIGSAVTLIERVSQNEYGRIDPDRAELDRRPDPFCTFFRNGRVGGKPAFSGANEACEQCEQKFARRLLNPAPGANLPTRDTGVAGLRCHMGLTDYLVPVTVGGRVVAGLIAGRRVEGEEDRLRIRKITGKLGKLTKAEVEAENAGDRLIEPVDEKVRERLVQEIANIPRRSEDLDRNLVKLAKFLSRLAMRQFDSVRRMTEDGIIERIDNRHGVLPRQFSDLRRETSELLDSIRDELDVEFIALFAASPKDLDDPRANLSLVAESGLALGTAKRSVELDAERMPPPAAGRDAEVTRGVTAVSALVKALETSHGCPVDLKDRLTKALFATPVEVGSHLRALLCVGPAKSEVSPETSDLQFLARVARAVSRRYYALAAELERRWLADKLDTEGAARREAESQARELGRTEGFTYFDARKVLNQCLERKAGRIEERGVELDTRDCLDRLTFRGDRKAITDLFLRLLDEGIERTHIDPEKRKGSPMRVFLKRSRTRLFFGVEVIGEFFGPRERREFFARDEPADAHSRDRPDDSASASRPTLSGEFEVLRRHEGRLRVDSERLHRLEQDRNRWIGKTTFLIDLPLPVRPETVNKEPEATAPGVRKAPQMRREPTRAVPAASPAAAQVAVASPQPAPVAAVPVEPTPQTDVLGAEAPPGPLTTPGL